ncbi:glycosyltransferase family 8 protein [Ruegeria arenilitoris]|uniref:glycosyltransferase family 8 protein n=1 Tax=Ruegeria arenilitoris TaxID=1173585 RepID=UPI00147C068B|nr:glycosyltransferase family 8 protein [Ruegeria arenilitoris]
MPKHKHAVIFACDHNYIWPALLAANAVYDHAASKEFDIRIFSSTYVPDGFAERCRPGVTAEQLPMGDFSVKTGITERYSMATFLRLFAIRKIEADYDRILYLDADVAVRHGDVNVFWEADLGGRPAAAVRDWFNWGPVKPLNAGYMQSLGISEATGGYFNSGYLLVDAKEWARQDLVGEVLCFLDSCPELCRFHDQSALNYVLKGRWAEVSPLWNWQTKILHHILMIETRDPHVIHFNARRKPWRDRERMIGVAFKDPLKDLAHAVGWDAFDDEYSMGPMRRRKERVRAETIAALYQSLPTYMSQIWPYLSREDFIDTPHGERVIDIVDARSASVEP